MSKNSILEEQKRYICVCFYLSTYIESEKKHTSYNLF